MAFCRGKQEVYISCARCVRVSLNVGVGCGREESKSADSVIVDTRSASRTLHPVAQWPRSVPQLNDFGGLRVDDTHLRLLPAARRQLPVGWQRDAAGNPRPGPHRRHAPAPTSGPPSAVTTTCRLVQAPMG